MANTLFEASFIETKWFIHTMNVDILLYIYVLLSVVYIIKLLHLPHHYAAVHCELSLFLSLSLEL